MIKAEISTIEEEFEKSRVKAHVRTRRGKLERVKEFSRKREKKPAKSKETKRKVRNKSDSSYTIIELPNLFRALK